ncbi:TPA: Abi family protein [Listeria monocytogenes]|nr:Abi family protein [Listeria monocytogenes]
MENVKKFKTIDEQIEILLSRGMKVPDRQLATETMKYIQYYRLSGYWLSFYKSKDTFRAGTDFNTILGIYRFDRELRACLAPFLAHIEIAVRSILAYKHAEEFGSTGYYKSDNFKDLQLAQKWISDFINEISYKNDNAEIFIRHHKTKYNSIFPVWVALEIVTFGKTSKLFSNTSGSFKKKVADEFEVNKHVKNRFKDEYITNWIHVAVVLRNMCAHHSRLYDKWIKVKPKLTKQDKVKLNISVSEESTYSYKVLHVIYAIKNLVRDEYILNEFIDKLDVLFCKYEMYIDKEKIGFPENWKNLLKSP